MQIHTNISLKNFTTMRLGGPARFFAEVRSKEEVQTLYKNAKAKNIPIFVIGSGSNLIARDEGYPGLIMKIRMMGFEIIDEDEYSKTIKVGAGEDWDEVVKKTVDMQLSGVETMSGIPGTAGATPVQNVGAYGQEIADTLVSLEAYDVETDSFVELTNEQCEFSYRHSIFRGRYQGRYIITSITIRLRKLLPAPPFYEGLQNYLDKNNITIYTHQSIRDAVLAVRKNKLPPIDEKPSAGSFFKNAIVEDWKFNEVSSKFPDMPSFNMPDGSRKVPTGWLIDQAGLKGKLINGIRVHEGNTLVLVNESAQSYNDLATAREEISGVVRDKFQIIIEQEPLEII